MVNAVLPAMRARHSGLIINFGSLGATLPVPFHGYLSASKAAVTTYSDALRLELKHLGVDVSVVEPGFTATHPGERFAQMRVSRSIDDYTEQEKRTTAVMQQGQTRRHGSTDRGRDRARDHPLRRPVPYYLVGREKWLAAADQNPAAVRRRVADQPPLSAVEMSAHRSPTVVGDPLSGPRRSRPSSA